jgi:Thioesterase-like superfamily
MSPPPNQPTTPPGTFRAASSVLPVGTPPRGPAPAGTVDRWSATVQQGWDIAGNANGGYLLAIAARAMGASLGRTDPITVTAHYLSPGKPGPVTVEVEVAKQGRMFGTATATLASAERPLLRVIGTFGSLGGTPTAELVDVDPAAMPPPDRCIPIEPTDTFPPPFMGRVELRLHPEDAAFSQGTPSGRPLMRGWFLPTHRVQRQSAGGLDPNRRAHRARAGPARAGMAPVPVRHPLRHGWVPRGGRRDLGRVGPVGGPVPPARPPAAHLSRRAAALLRWPG